MQRGVVATGESPIEVMELVGDTPIELVGDTPLELVGDTPTELVGNTPIELVGDTSKIGVLNESIRVVQITVEDTPTA